MHLKQLETSSQVVRVLHPAYEMQTLAESRRTEAENLEVWSEANALRKEMSRLREHYRRLQQGASHNVESDIKY